MTDRVHTDSAHTDRSHTDSAHTDRSHTDRAHETALHFSHSSDRRAAVIAASLDQEVGEIDDDRSAVSIDRSETDIVVTIEATDLTALRAAITTWIGLVDVAESVGSIADAGD